MSRSSKQRNEQILLYVQLDGIRQTLTYDETFWTEEITGLNYFFLQSVYDINIDNYLEYYSFKADQRVFLLSKKDQCSDLRYILQSLYSKTREQGFDKKVLFVNLDLSLEGFSKDLVEHMAGELFGESELTDKNCYLLGVDYEKKTRGSYLIYNS